jgi:hypothetical protein
MKAISHRSYALSVCAAAAMLASCGGATQPSLLNGMEDNATQLAFNSVTPLSSASESLTATDVSISSYCPGTDGASFSASGTATGVYPGTFTANGYWNDGPNPHHWIWDFRESVKISSNALTIHVHIHHVQGSHKESRFINCKRFGGIGHPITVKYKSYYGFGKAEIENIQQRSFSEALDGL